MTNEKQGAAEWLRGIINGSCEKETYPTCYEIAETFFGVGCLQKRTCGSCILAMLTTIADRIDGEPIEVGDTVYCDGEDEALTVTSISGVDSDYCCVTVKNADSSHCTVEPSRLSHERPDSWERIEEDAAKRVCEYAGAKKSVVDADRYTCLECPYDEPGPHTDAGCNERMRLDLVRRAKALAKAGE